MWFFCFHSFSSLLSRSPHLLVQKWCYVSKQTRPPSHPSTYPLRRDSHSQEKISPNLFLASLKVKGYKASPLRARCFFSLDPVSISTLLYMPTTTSIPSPLIHLYITHATITGLLFVSFLLFPCFLSYIAVFIK